jgi:hypothetical protein
MHRQKGTAPNSEPFNGKDNKFPTLNQERDLGEGGSLPCRLIINGMIFLRGESFGESPKGEGMTKIRGPRHRSQGGGRFPETSEPKGFTWHQAPSENYCEASPWYPWVRVGPQRYAPWYLWAVWVECKGLHRP